MPLPPRKADEVEVAPGEFVDEGDEPEIDDSPSEDLDGDHLSDLRSKLAKVITEIEELADAEEIEVDLSRLVIKRSTPLRPLREVLSGKGHPSSVVDRVISKTKEDERRVAEEVLSQAMRLTQELLSQAVAKVYSGVQALGEPAASVVSAPEEVSSLSASKRAEWIDWIRENRELAAEEGWDEEKIIAAMKGDGLSDPLVQELLAEASDSAPSGKQEEGLEEEAREMFRRGADFRTVKFNLKTAYPGREKEVDEVVDKITSWGKDLKGVEETDPPTPVTPTPSAPPTPASPAAAPSGDTAGTVPPIVSANSQSGRQKAVDLIKTYRWASALIVLVALMALFPEGRALIGNSTFVFALAILGFISFLLDKMEGGRRSKKSTK